MITENDRNDFFQQKYSWLCLICGKATATVPAMLGHLRFKHRRRAEYYGGGSIETGGTSKKQRLAVYVYSDDLREWAENIKREWGEAHKGKPLSGARAKILKAKKPIEIIRAYLTWK